jgi:hypothetical protein
VTSFPSVLVLEVHEVALASTELSKSTEVVGPATSVVDVAVVEVSSVVEPAASVAEVAVVETSVLSDTAEVVDWVTVAVSLVVVSLVAVSIVGPRDYRKRR